VRAVKIMRTDDEEKIQIAQKEYDIQKKIKCPHVVEVKEFFFDTLRNTVYTVMDFIEGT
jgi:hypothetical protein